MFFEKDGDLHGTLWIWGIQFKVADKIILSFESIFTEDILLVSIRGIKRVLERLFVWFKLFWYVNEVLFILLPLWAMDSY